MTTRSRSLWLPAIAVAVLVPIFFGLGMWQVHRAGEKRALQQEVDERAREAPVRLGQTPQSAQALRFRHVTARGRYEPEYQILIDNRVHQGVPGYYVVTPLRLEGGEMRVLVNRGWMPLGASRQQLPAIDTPSGTVEITGMVTVPAEKVFTLGAPASGWQPVWSHLDMKRYVASVPFAVQPVAILLDAGAPGGFTHAWTRLDAGIAVHQGYAFQWFALAALAAVILATMLYRAPRRRKKSK